MFKIYYVKQPGFWYEDSPEHNLFVAEAKELDIELKVIRTVNEWSYAELVIAPLIIMHPPDLIPGGYEGEYDYSEGCEVCGYGAVQKSKLIVDKRAMARRRLDMAWVGCGDLVVSEKVQGVIHRQGLTGTELWGTDGLRKRDQSYPECYQVVSMSILPPMKDDCYQVEPKWICRSCRRQGVRFGSEIRYSREVLENAKDINCTGERMGPMECGKNSRIYVIRRQVYEAFEKEGIRCSYYEPIKFE